MAIEMTCPTCGSHDISKNGTTRRGKQNYKCRDCGRQFVEDPQWQPKSKDTFGLVNVLLLEKIPLAGIARVTQVSDSWLQEYVNDADAEVTRTASVVPKAKGKLTVQMD
ncbi:MAG: IS1 family transposase, partial [Cyanobacteria bacterium J06638_22]